MKAKKHESKREPRASRRERSDRLRDFRAISAVEGLQPSDDMKRVFEMFEREGWPDERRRKYLVERYGNGSR